MIILSIGSNLPSKWGNRIETLLNAIKKLENYPIKTTTTSKPFFSRPLTLEKNDLKKLSNFTNSLENDFNLPKFAYINFTLLVETNLPPEQLLYCLKQIEKSAGRITGQRWASRPLDMDIICYKKRITGKQIEKKQLGDIGYLPLCLPHPSMKNRNFVLRPLQEVAPFWHHPITGLTAKKMLDQLK